MPISTYKVDEGRLTLGAVGSLLEVSAQVTECAVDFDEDVEDAVRTLSGDQLEGDAKYPATLSGVIIQDLSDDGIVDWSWTNRGLVVPFSFSPATAEAKAVTGMVRVKPLKVGGEVGTKGPTSDLDWAIIGDPVLAADLG